MLQKDLCTFLEFSLVSVYPVSVWKAHIAELSLPVLRSLAEIRWHNGTDPSPLKLPTDGRMRELQPVRYLFSFSVQKLYPFKIFCWSVSFLFFIHYSDNIYFEVMLRKLHWKLWGKLFQQAHEHIKQKTYSFLNISTFIENQTLRKKHLSNDRFLMRSGLANK